MTATIERLPTGPLLPRPAPGRMRPLRAGIRNVWDYDDQELWFEGGRLILRGQNAAGKSKALELLLPFVLDGDTRSERLDPFGTRVKTMYWNLIDFADDRASAIGYTWVEFGRIDEDGAESYVTCLVGMRAVRSAGRRVDPWFAVTAARVGHDLELAPAGVPLTAEQLRAALPEGSAFSKTARDHRGAVDQALFGLGPDRFDALLHLLLQLRRPKLSEKLDMARLREYLSDALPPLERHRMESLAQAFAHLDEDTAEIERLEACAAELRRFLDNYRAHAQVQTRLRADAVRGANTQFDKVTETERRQRAAQELAAAALARINSRRAELAASMERLTGQLRGLDLSKVHALREVEDRAAEAERTAVVLTKRAGEDRHRADSDASVSKEAALEAETVLGHFTTSAAAILAVAGTAGLGAEHGLHAAQLAEEPDRARSALAGAADRRLQLLHAVRTTGREAEVAAARISSAEAERSVADDRLAVASEEHASAISALDDAAERLVEEVLGWASQWNVTLPEGEEQRVVSAVLDGGRLVAASLLAGARDASHAERRRVAASSAQSTARRTEAANEASRVEAQAEEAPPARPGRPRTRPEGHAPLWACIDFAPDLPPAERAGLEAALEASGLLDALVSPAGDLMDAATLDTWIAGATPAHDDRGLPGLVPVAGGPVSQDAVALALAGVVTSGAAVSPDGSWSGGPLHGRWSKQEAEYVGATARAQARRRRIAALTAEIEDLDRALAGLRGQDEALVAELARLDLAERAWPPADALRDAVGALSRAVVALSEAQEALVVANDRLRQARADGQEAIGALRRAEDAAGCRAGTVDDAVDAVHRYRTDLASVAAVARRAQDAQAGATQAARRAEASADVAQVSEADADRAGTVATTARGEADELRSIVGADADAILARQAELTQAHEQAQAERDQLLGERDSALREDSAAAARLETTEEDRRHTEARRAEALSRLAELAATELARLALGPVPAERDLAQVTAGLVFARSAYDRLREVVTDQRAIDAVSNRFHNGITTLRSQLGADFDPYLDTSDGLEVCYATLNGAVVGLTELSSALEGQIRRRRDILSSEERRLIEQHLLTEVGTHLGERVHAAWALTQRMNQQLAEHPTRDGVSLRLSWQVAPDAGPGAEGAMKLLRQEVNLLDQAERAQLAAFLHERVRTARDDAEGADVVERLASALDYRRWHTFGVIRRSGDREERMTARSHGVGSGGEQAKLAHLPLFAATAAYYSSARRDAPHLLMLDEAFAGIDDSQRGDCMGMLVDLDLDMVLTNYAEWGCYPEVPAVAVYHLERTPGRHGVTALRFVWDGHGQREDDPWLDSRLPAEPDDGLFA